MSQAEEYKLLFQAKNMEFNELNDQFNELSEQSMLIINDLQAEVKDLKRKNQLLNRQVSELKEKRKYFNSSVERQIEIAHKERNQFKKKFVQFEKKVIQLQIVNQSLQNQLRATKSVLSQYQSRTQKTMQELALLQIQLQESTSSNKEQVARLKSQLKQTEQQLYVLHHKQRSNHDLNTSQHKIDSQPVIESPSALQQSQSINGFFGVSSNSSSALFKQTLRDIREYLGKIDGKKGEIRSKWLKQK